VVLDHGGAAFDPVAVVHVEDAPHLAHFGLVDVATDDAVNAAPTRFVGHGLFEVLDELQGVLHLDLQVGRKAPVPQTQPVADARHQSVQHQEGSIGPIAEEGEPARVLDDAVELVAVHDQEPPAVRRLVDRVTHHHHASEVDAAEVARDLVVVAGHIDHLHALAGHPQDLLDHIVVGLRPVPAALQLPAVDDVADQIELLALHPLDEVQQHIGLAALGAQVHVADEHRAAAQNLGFGRHRRSPGRRRTGPGYDDCVSVS
jgi:hypothetical protein